MTRAFLFACLMLIAPSFVFAQETTKLDLRLYLRLKNGVVRKERMPLLVSGDLNKIKALTEQISGVYKFGYADISSIEIPEEQLIAFANHSDVMKIENTSARGTALMDTARIRNNIDSILSGYAPLTQAYTGKGVVMGIIDGGIYWQHGDFRKPTDSTTRIRYIWDQVASGSNSPMPYQYGNQWSWIDIDNGNCAHVPPANDFGHGTCVAGIAAGNSLSTRGTIYENKLTGVAPETEIVAVRVKNDGNFLSNVADAVDYIFKKADALGKPCVINTSIGTYYGSHDGKDLATEAIEYLLDERKGRVLVAAGGNGGHIPHHLSYNIPSDSAFTYFNVNTAFNEVYFDLWADTAEFKNARFAVGAHNAAGVNLGRIDYLNILTDFNPPPGTSVVLNRNLYQGTTLIGQISMNATLDEGRYHVEFLITPASSSYVFRLQTSGSGRFDLWSSSALIGSADMRSYGNLIGDSTSYRYPDSLKTIVSSWQCSDKVITVGNYSNQAGYIDRDSNYVDLTQAPYNETVGKRFATSSFGPTRDGRLKPDVMATGSTTIATGEAGFISLATAPQNRVKVSITKKHIRNGGTSMASPIVAGVAALYLEKRPTADYNEIKQLLLWTALRDSFTTAISNPEYGNGKVNAFAMLTYDNIVYGAQDTACLNYQPLANIDSGGCVAKVYGCTDSTADNYNPAANINNGSCTYNTGLTYQENPLLMSVTPNPANDYTVFSIRNAATQNMSIRIVNLLGETVQELPLRGHNSLILDTQNLSAGVYGYQLINQNAVLKSGKLMIN
ncbi:MAG: S8 family peptidase [Bacteroidetes bacterium]|nr:S8 family peptidase [Bacteroidota bacterium]